MYYSLYTVQCQPYELFHIYVVYNTSTKYNENSHQRWKAVLERDTCQRGNFVSGVEKFFFLGPERQKRKFAANIWAMLHGKMVGKSGIYLTVIPRTRIVYELIADEVRSTESAMLIYDESEWNNCIIIYTSTGGNLTQY